MVTDATDNLDTRVTTLEQSNGFGWKTLVTMDLGSFYIKKDKTYEYTIGTFPVDENILFIRLKLVNLTANQALGDSGCNLFAYLMCNSYSSSLYAENKIIILPSSESSMSFSNIYYTAVDCLYSFNDQSGRPYGLHFGRLSSGSSVTNISSSAIYYLKLGGVSASGGVNFSNTVFEFEKFTKL